MYISHWFISTFADSIPFLRVHPPATAQPLGIAWNGAGDQDAWYSEFGNPKGRPSSNLVPTDTELEEFSIAAVSSTIVSLYVGT